MSKKNQNINDAFLMSYLLKETDTEQTKQVENWLKSSEQNFDYFNKLKQVWNETEKISPKPVVVNTNSAWDKVNSKINFDDEKSLKIRPPQKNILKILMKIAAVFVIIAGGITAFLIFNKHEIKQLALTAFDTKIIDTLIDGSIINLNKNSELIYPEKFTKNMRKVTLNGEAFFDIKPNAEKPFVIKVNNGNIKVLGTSFNVNSKPENDTEVFVKTGLVQLFTVNEKNDTFSIVLSAGEKGFFNKETGKPEILETNTGNVNDLYWLNNTIIFDDIKLFEAAQTLEKIFNVSIEFENDEIKNLRYTSTFYNDSIEHIINIIAETYSLNVSKKENTFLFSN